MDRDEFKDLAVGSVWDHKNGNRAHPVMVVYENVYTGSTWARQALDWHASMTKASASDTGTFPLSQEQKEMINDVVRDLQEHIRNCNDVCTRAEYFGLPFPDDLYTEGRRSANSLYIIELLKNAIGAENTDVAD